MHLYEALLPVSVTAWPGQRLLGSGDFFGQHRDDELDRHVARRPVDVRRADQCAITGGVQRFRNGSFGERTCDGLRNCGQCNTQCRKFGDRARDGSTASQRNAERSQLNLGSD
jgi:hypothetical protein